MEDDVSGGVVSGRSRRPIGVGGFKSKNPLDCTSDDECRTLDEEPPAFWILHTS